jgi:tRNA-dihydrouridine synthase
MIKTPEIARAIIRAAKEGAPKLPISVKTRIGYNKNEIATWIPVILSEGVAALTVHCRTRKEMSNVPARWEHIREVTALRDQLAPDTVIIGNGDIRDVPEGRAKALEFGADGVMIGRGIFGNPWLFAELHARPGKKVTSPTTTEKLKVMVEHTKLYEKLLGDIKSFAIMKKHYKAYVNGFDHAKELRTRLMEAKDSKEVEKVVKTFLKNGTIEAGSVVIHKEG